MIWCCDVDFLGLQCHDNAECVFIQGFVVYFAWLTFCQWWRFECFCHVVMWLSCLLGDIVDVTFLRKYRCLLVLFVSCLHMFFEVFHCHWFGEFAPTLPPQIDTTGYGFCLFLLFFLGVPFLMIFWCILATKKDAKNPTWRHISDTWRPKVPKWRPSGPKRF